MPLGSESVQGTIAGRTGGTVDEVIDEAHLGPTHILAAIQRFVTERQDRLARVRELAEAAAAN